MSFFNTSWYFEALKNFRHLFFHQPFSLLYFLFSSLTLTPGENVLTRFEREQLSRGTYSPISLFPAPSIWVAAPQAAQTVPHKVLQPLSLVYSAQMYLCSTNLHFYCTHYHCWWRLHTGHRHASPSPLSPICKYFLQSSRCAYNLDPTCSMIW